MTTYPLTENLTIEGYVSRRIRQLRKASGMTQAELGALAGCSHAQISVLETRPGSIGLATLQKLADALGVAPRELLP